MRIVAPEVQGMVVTCQECLEAERVFVNVV